MEQILESSINLAEKGYPVTEIAAHFWNKGAWALQDQRNAHGKDMLIDGTAPRWGEVFKNHNLANTMRVKIKILYII